MEVTSKMADLKVVRTGILGLGLIFASFSHWAYGNPLGIFYRMFGQTTTSINSSGMTGEWAPLVWLVGIMFLLSMGLVYCLRPKQYVGVTATLIGSFFGLFIVLTMSTILIG